MDLDTQTIILALTPVILLVVEYFLGKSEVPKANSIIEMIVNVVKLLGGKQS